MLTENSTIGAGDTFTSGILYSLLAHESDWTVSRRLDFASELAGRKIMQEGFKGLASFMQDKK
jgi:ketohexokinase